MSDGADKEASVRLTLANGNFLVSLRKIGDESEKEGERVKRSGSAMSSGFKGATGALGELGSKVRDVLGMATGLVGAFSIEEGVRHTIAVREQFRDLEFQINKTGNAVVSWEDLHEAAVSAALKHGQKVTELGDAMKNVFSSTGDEKFAVASINAIGAAAGATGENVNGWANAAQLLQRKFGATADSIDSMMATIVSKTGAGGPALEDLSAKFGLLAGEAVEAGFKGGDGLARLLDMMISLDSRAGEKLIPGLKKMFQTLKDGSSSLKGLEKETGFKFKEGEDAVEKLKKMMGSDKGRKALEAKLTGDVRVIYDELARPFEEAMTKAKKGGATKEAAAAAGAKALDESLAKLGKTTLTAEKMYAESIQGAKEDPRARLDAAMEKMSESFMQPEMLSAIDSLAEQLPKLASVVAKLVEFTVKHPLMAGLGAAGASMFGGFAKGAAGAITTAIVDQIKQSAMKSAVGQAVGGAVTSVVGSSKAGIVPMAAKGSGIGGLLAVGAAGVAGYMAGQAVSDAMLDPQNDDRNTLARAQAAEGQGVSVAEKKKALAEARKVLEGMKGGPGITDMLFGGLAEAGGSLGLLSKDDVSAARGSHSKDVGNATDRVAELERQIKELSSAPQPPAKQEAPKEIVMPKKMNVSVENGDENARKIADYMRQQPLRVSVIGGPTPGRGPVTVPPSSSGG